MKILILTIFIFFVNCFTSLDLMQENVRKLAFRGIIVKYDNKTKIGKIVVRKLMVNKSLSNKEASELLSYIGYLSNNNKLLNTYFQLNNVTSTKEYFTGDTNYTDLTIDFINDSCQESNLLQNIYGNFTGYFNNCTYDTSSNSMTISFICRNKIEFSYPEGVQSSVSVYSKDDPVNPRYALIWNRDIGPYEIGIYGLHLGVGFKDVSKFFGINKPDNS